MPPPIVAWVTAVTTTPTASVISVSTRPFAGCASPAAKPGLLPQVTAVTICIGITHSRKYATHPVNTGKLKSEINPECDGHDERRRHDAHDGLLET